MDHIITTKAIVLSLLDFRDSSKIVTLYSETEGMIKLFVNLSKKTAPAMRALLSPLTTAEWSISKKGRSDFYRLHDATLLTQRIALRNDLGQLQAAQQLIQLFCKVQWPELPSPPLFWLLEKSLALIERSSVPENILALFQIKLLKHEGMLQMESYCISCMQVVKVCYRYKGECYCKEHALPWAVLFEAEEEKLLRQMFDARESAQLLDLSLEGELRKKIDLLFGQCFSIS